MRRMSIPIRWSRCTRLSDHADRITERKVKAVSQGMQQACLCLRYLLHTLYQAAGKIELLRLI